MNKSTTGNPIPGFNPITQNITFFAADGITPISISIAEIDVYRGDILSQCISYSMQLGASIIMLICVLLLTQPQKRTTALFYINVTSLIMSVIENTLVIAYFPSEYTEFYTWFSFDLSYVPTSTIATDVACNTFLVLFIAAIETSLFLQTRVICDTIEKFWKWGIMAFSMIVVVVTVAFTFMQVVMNNMAILDQNYYLNPAWNWYDVGKAVDISYTLSIWYFCFIFVSKLVVTMWKRKQMGMKQWGPMKIICIMGGCTMIVPSIFSVLQFYATKWYWAPGPIAHTLVAIMLPLSSIWASASLEGRTKNTYSPEARRNQFFGSFSSAQSGSEKARLTSMASNTGTGTGTSGSRKHSTGPLSPLSTSHAADVDVEGGLGGDFGASGDWKENGETGDGMSRAKSLVGGLFGGKKADGKKAGGGQVMVEKTYSVERSKGHKG